VVRCATHGQASTLYPPGHVPYGRVAVAPVDSCGELIRSPPAALEPQGRPAWELTLFAAAKDAATGHLWPKDASDRHDRAKHADTATPEDPGCRRTQGRHLRLAATLLGIAADLGSRAREAVAVALAVPVLMLRQAARDLDGARLYRDEGRIIATVLAQLRPARGLGDQLLAAGELASLWGAPRRWDPGGIEVPWPFRRSAAPT
jgi:hypothetical protein